MFGESVTIRSELKLFQVAGISYLYYIILNMGVEGFNKNESPPPPLTIMLLLPYKIWVGYDNYNLNKYLLSLLFDGTLLLNTTWMSISYQSMTDQTYSLTAHQKVSSIKFFAKIAPVNFSALGRLTYATWINVILYGFAWTRKSFFFRQSLL